MAQSIISWKAPEYEYRRKSADWYWAVWIIVISVSVISVLFNDILLAILILLSAFTLTLMAKRPAQIIDYKITTTGVQIRNNFYPYENIESFGIEEIEGMPPKLLLKSKRLYMPLFSMPLKSIDGTIDPEDVRFALKDHLKEEEQTEPVSQKLMEYLGF